MLQLNPSLLFLFVTFIIYSPFPSSGEYSDILSANISTKWINNEQSIIQNRILNVIVRPILVRQTHGPEFTSVLNRSSTDGSEFLPAFGCGFICTTELCASFLFSIFLGYLTLRRNATYPPVVWSANRGHPVQENATLEFSRDGDLLLRDFDGTQVWSTNTSGKSVVGMKLNEVGSLVLYDKMNQTVWSSLDHPTDCWVQGQTLRQGQRLTADVSSANSTQGSLYLSIVSGGFQAFIGSQLYYDSATDNPPTRQEKPTHIMFNNGSLDVYAGSSKPVALWLHVPITYSVQYMQLDYMGHLIIYEWSSTGWVSLGDVFRVAYYHHDDYCTYPNVCGENGICSNGQCSCPASDDGSINYFKPVDHTNPNLGCVPFNALSCNSSKTHKLLSLFNVSYFSIDRGAAPYNNNTNAEACKQACLANCSCKAAFFQYDNEEKDFGTNCYLEYELYSLNGNLPHYNNIYSSAFIKVQSFPTTNMASRTNSSNSNFIRSKVSVRVIAGASVASLLAFILIIACAIAFVRRKYSYREVEDVDEFAMLPGLPTRFAFEDLRVATADFLRKLGEGGFGSVFEGTLIDGTKVAVKRLDSAGQGKKEFLAEVETIGSIHHVHLVRLIGFCAEKFYRLLVYEYMPNGSLDKWIFYKDHDFVIDWQTRRSIINDIAKGLAYLHEDCRQKIVHLDIKPQNILLDENFNAKVSDFGLAKLINRDQVEVVTRMRGTPGYLAPEWMTSVITEKVDVFSFGVVVLEIVCGRRNLDYSKDEEDFHLISLLQRKVTENKLADMIDCRCTNMQSHIDDVVMIIHLAMWCLQSDNNKRPLMSMVLKVLDGSLDVEANLDYNFTNPTPYVRRNANIIESFQPTPSTLSGPR